MGEVQRDKKRAIWFGGGVLAVMLLIAGSGWFFIELADEVLEGETHAFDKKILLSMREPGDISRPWGPQWFREMGRDLTALGGIPVLTLITVICVGGMFIAGQHKTAFLILIAVVGGGILTFSFKSGFDRPRPDLVPHEMHVYTQSFPSGHAMLSTVTYLSLGFLMAGSYEKRAVQIYIVGASVFIAFMVGMSRVYLGVHWPTDVLAGWALGSAWALVCWLSEYWLREKGRIKELT